VGGYPPIERPQDNRGDSISRADFFETLGMPAEEGQKKSA
jgi:hypothetical protein